MPEVAVPSTVAQVTVLVRFVLPIRDRLKVATLVALRNGFRVEAVVGLQAAPPLDSTSVTTRLL